jgi:GTPase SAR1 family protein
LEDLKEVGSFVDVAGLFHAGIASEKYDSKRLFFKDSSFQLLQRLRKWDYRGFRVFGPPGIGKSCIVWALVCDEFLRNQKKVLWVHVEKDAKPIHILMVKGQVYEIVGADHECVSESDADIVVIDGVVGNDEDHKRYMKSLWEWRFNPNRKAIQVASMQVKINTTSDDIKGIIKFTLAPWSLEDYVCACRNDLFFDSVFWAFEGTHEEDIEDRIGEKFYFAGSSARWMFNYTIDEVKEKIIDHLEACPNSIDLLKGVIGQNSPVSVNHLWVGYRSELGGFRKFFVSQYVAREVLRSGGSEAVKLAYEIARGLNNPSFTGWVVEMDFVQRLSNSVKNQIIVHGLSIEDDKWDVRGIVDFELGNIVSLKVFVLKYFWLHPKKWNQGGYDLVCLLKIGDEYVLRFVQITAAHEHSLKLKYFKDFATTIIEKFNIVVPRIEIIMIIPDEETALHFRILHSKVKYSGLLCAWICGETNENWQKGKEEDQVKVLWFDSNK